MVAVVFRPDEAEVSQLPQKVLGRAGVVVLDVALEDAVHLAGPVCTNLSEPYRKPPLDRVVESKGAGVGHEQALDDAPVCVVEIGLLRVRFGKQKIVSYQVSGGKGCSFGIQALENRLRALRFLDFGEDDGKEVEPLPERFGIEVGLGHLLAEEREVVRDGLRGDRVGGGPAQRVEVGGAVPSGEHELAGEVRVAVEQKVARLDFVRRGMGEGGARAPQMANERDQDKRDGRRALLTVHDGEAGVAVLVAFLGSVEKRSHEVL